MEKKDDARRCLLLSSSLFLPLEHVSRPFQWATEMVANGCGAACLCCLLLLLLLLLEVTHSLVEVGMDEWEYFFLVCPGDKSPGASNQRAR